MLLPRTALLCTAVVALVMGATGCGASKTATKTAGENVKITKSEAGGDTLPLGRSAVSPYIDYGTENQAKPTKVGVSVDAVRKGSLSDLKSFNLDRKQRRSTPYYVEASFKNLGSFALSRNLLRASLEDADGREYRPTTVVLIGGTFRPCPRSSASPLRPGRSFTGCSVVMLPKGAEPGRVRFQGDVTKDPLFWEAGV
jgi:hypothetical protein